MKKRLLQLSLLLVMSLLPTTVAAQDDIKAIGAAVDTILRVYTQDYIMDPLIRKVFEQNHSAPVAARIARSYFRYYENEKGERTYYKSDTTKAFQYIKEAVRIDSSCADAYIVASDICATYGQKERALAWLNAGIKANPSDSMLYIASTDVLFKVAGAQVRKFRKEGNGDSISLKLFAPAVEQLKKRKESDPNFPLDLELARFYYRVYDKGGLQPLNEIASHYSKVDKEELTLGDLGAYALALFYTNQLSSTVDVTGYALKKYPQDHGLNQFSFYAKLGVAGVEKAKLTKASTAKDSSDVVRLYNNAIAAADSFFIVADKSKIEGLHYLRYGEAFNGAGQYDKAIEIYNYVINMPNATEGDKKTAYSHITTSMGNKVKRMMKAGDYKGAADLYGAYYNQRKAEGRLDFYIYYTYADIYMKWSTEFTDVIDKKQILMKADEIYAEGVRTSKEYNDAFQYQRVTIQLAFDPDKKKGTAIPFIKDGISMILSKGAPDMLDGGQRARLISFYMTMCLYGLEKHISKKEVADYADKVMDIDPANEDAPKFAAWAAKK